MCGGVYGCSVVYTVADVSATTAVTDGAASEAPETVVRLNQYLFTEVAQLRQTYPLPALDIYVNSTLELSGPST